MIVAYLIALIVIVAITLLALDRLAPALVTRYGLALERRRSGLQLKQLAIPGFTMPYLEGGVSAPGEAPLVLIHGFGGDKDNFTHIARHLTPHYRVICLDLPGFGEATRDHAATYGIAEQVARVHAFLTQLGLTRVHIGGNSMGGFITAQFAATYPEMVASVWLLDPAGTAAAHESEMIKTYLAGGEIPLLVANEASFPTLMAYAMSRPPFMPRSVRVTFARRAVADFPLHQKILTQFAHGSPLLEDQYTQLHTPALIVWGKEDKMLHPRGADTLSKLFVNSEVKLMDGIGHMPMMEAPRTTAIDYLEFRKSTRFGNGLG